MSVLKDREPKPVASRSTGYTDTGEQCPEPDDDVETKKVAHWNTNPQLPDGLPTPHANGLWKYDPDFDSSIVDQPWMRECLFAPTFPPPEASRPDPPRTK